MVGSLGPMESGSSPMSRRCGLRRPPKQFAERRRRWEIGPTTRPDSDEPRVKRPELRRILFGTAVAPTREKTSFVKVLFTQNARPSPPHYPEVLEGHATPPNGDGHDG